MLKTGFDLYLLYDHCIGNAKILMLVNNWGLSI